MPKTRELHLELAGIIRRTVTYSHDGDLFSCEESRNTCFLVGADVVAGKNDEEVVAKHLNTVYQCAFMWRLMRHSVFPLTMITQQISLREEPIARVTTRAFQKELLPKGCLYRGHGLRCHWFMVAHNSSCKPEYSAILCQLLSRTPSNAFCCCCLHASCIRAMSNVMIVSGIYRQGVRSGQA